MYLLHCEKNIVLLKESDYHQIIELVVDACTDNPCANGGECKVGTKGEAQCTCAQNYAGPTCDGK